MVLEIVRPDLSGSFILGLLVMWGMHYFKAEFGSCDIVLLAGMRICENL